MDHPTGRAEMAVATSVQERKTWLSLPKRMGRDRTSELQIVQRLSNFMQLEDSRQTSYRSCNWTTLVKSQCRIMQPNVFHKNSRINTFCIHCNDAQMRNVQQTSNVQRPRQQASSLLQRAQKTRYGQHKNLNNQIRFENNPVHFWCISV